MERGPITCHDPADFPGHADISGDEQDRFATQFSGSEESTATKQLYLGPDVPPVYRKYSDGHGVNYEYEARWIEGCLTIEPNQSFQWPVGSPATVTAYLLVREAFTKCNNGGIGGWSQVGCLKYTFWGAR
ncbi:hypothetical protein MN608_04088 [Microdochium nivale]|nr:hypothetical protein MN608_04088 [Microdochium nivale]